MWDDRSNRRTSAEKFGATRTGHFPSSVLVTAAVALSNRRIEEADRVLEDHSFTLRAQQTHTHEVEKARERDDDPNADQLLALKELPRKRAPLDEKLQRAEDEIAAAIAELMSAARGSDAADKGGPDVQIISSAELGLKVIKQRLRASGEIAKLRDKKCKVLAAEMELLQESRHLVGTAMSPAANAALSRLARERALLNEQILRAELQFAELRAERVSDGSKARSPSFGAVAAKAADGKALLSQHRQTLQRRAKQPEVTKKEFQIAPDEKRRQQFSQLERIERLRTEELRDQLYQEQLCILARQAIEREHLLQTHRLSQWKRLEVNGFHGQAVLRGAAGEALIQRAEAAWTRAYSVDNTCFYWRCVQAAQASMAAEEIRLGHCLEQLVSLRVATEEEGLEIKNKVGKHLRHTFELALSDTAGTRYFLEQRDRPRRPDEETRSAPHARPVRVDPQRQRELAAQYAQLLEAEGRMYTTAMVATANGPSWVRWRSDDFAREA